MTDEEIRDAGAALVTDWPPLTDEQVANLAVLTEPEADAA